MEIFNLFESDNREKWIAQIEKCDWSAAAFLAKLLRENRFEETLGADGSLFVMVDGEKLAAFCTLTNRDSIKDESLYPWIGYVFTFPEYRGNRYSQKLIAYMEEQAKQEGHSHVYIATKHVGLYEKFGYEYVDSQLDEWRTETRIYTKEL